MRTHHSALDEIDKGVDSLHEKLGAAKYARDILFPRIEEARLRIGTLYKKCDRIRIDLLMNRETEFVSYFQMVNEHLENIDKLLAYAYDDSIRFADGTFECSYFPDRVETEQEQSE